MCGIVGFTRFRNTHLSDADQLIREMAAPLQSRGPDADGYHVTPSVALGHKRLSIIDLDSGAQPMTTADGRYTIVFNGEIYNYIELKEHLIKRGCEFSTTSDTEVLLYQFALDGLDALQVINGMFAFAVWDHAEERIYVARDRLGIKPLYYSYIKGDLVFGSELKALMHYPDLPRDLNLLSVSKFFTYSYIPAPHTIYEKVHKLEPGCYLVADADQLFTDYYWDIPLEDNPISTQTVDENAEQLLVLLQDSVHMRLRSDVPLGVFLSGGIDSSAITALASMASSKRIHTFSVGFEESSYDESPYALEVSQRYDTDHHHEVLSAKRAIELMPRVMQILDEPFADASILPTYMLSQFTRQSVKVCLGGDGGDELFAGYPSFQAHKLMERLSFLPAHWRDRINRMAKKIPVSHKYASMEYLIQQFFKGAGVSPEIRFFLWMGIYGNEQKRQLLSAGVQQQLLRTNAFEDIINYVRQSGLTKDFERLEYLCMKLYMQDGILTKVDRASMAHSLEVRVPFLDHHVVEYAATINPIYKLHGFNAKYVLKKATEHLLPKSIIKRRKAGFMIPLADWLANDLRPLVEEMCSEERIKADGLFNPQFVRTMLDDHFAHRKDYRKMIWTLLAFQLWRENYDR